MVTAFGLAGLAGIYLAAVGGWPVIAIGLASIAAGIAYTGGPYPLGYHGLGDLFVMVFFGFVAVAGTAYVQAGAVPAAGWAAAFAVGALATAVLVVNNVRDVETDRRAGKRTLPAIFGRRAGVVEFAALVAAAYLTPAAMAAAGVASAWTLLCWATLPLGLRLARVVASTAAGPALNHALPATVRLMLLHGVLLAAGLALGGPRP
jgi:1,4-dihydroxy-2-naphthoate octaprenyltransferase